MIKNDSEIIAKIQDYMQILEKSDKFNGAILISQGDNILVSQGYGLANFEHKVPNTSQTKFRIGSITKEFTATAILMLQNMGKLKLHDRISLYLSDSPLEWEKITIHHLLNHTAGIPNYTSSLNWKITSKEYLTLPKLISLFKDKTLDFTPGEKFEYCNSGYILLGAIIEQISGISYERFLEENIFKPIKMNHTGYDNFDKILKHRASGYEISNNTLVNADYLEMRSPYAAGALYSTVEDLLLWDRALQSESLLSKDNLEAMLTPTPLLTNYGYGFEIEQKFDCKVIGHTGGINGFLSSHQHYLGKDVCIVVLSNIIQDPIPYYIAQDLAAILFNEKYSTPKKQSAINLNSEDYQALKGEYQVSAYMNLIIKADTRGLIVEATGGSLAKFFPESELKFYQQYGDRQIEFFNNELGKVDHLILQQNGMKIKACRVEG